MAILGSLDVSYAPSVRTHLCGGASEWYPCRERLTACVGSPKQPLAHARGSAQSTCCRAATVRERFFDTGC